MNMQMKVRDSVSRTLSFIPINLFNTVRNKQHKVGFISLISEALIRKLIRYRKIGSEIKAFPLLDNPDLQFMNDGSFISRQLYWRGMRGYEYGEAKLWKYLCSRTEIQKAVEMGANIGYFSIIGASASKLEYIAIEANPRTAGYLNSNVKLNSLDNITVIASAIVGEKTEELTELFIPIEENNETAPTGAYLGGGESINRASMSSVKVSTIEARSVVSNADIIKLDIEGFEFIVLNSIGNEIDEFRPLIWVEVRRNTHELRNLLSVLSSESSYEIYAVGDRKLSKISSEDIRCVVLQESFNTRDVLLVPSEKASIINSYKA
jgi:FkbM family methyltransferase